MNISVKQIIGLVAVYQIYKHRKSIMVVTDYAGSVLTEVVAGSSERVGRKIGDDLTEALFGHRDFRETPDSDDSYDAWRAARHARQNRRDVPRFPTKEGYTDYSRRNA